MWLDTKLTWIEANGRPSVMVSHDAAVVAFLAISASEKGIDQLMWVMSPAKLDAISKLLPTSEDVS